MGSRDRRLSAAAATALLAAAGAMAAGGCSLRVSTGSLEPVPTAASTRPVSTVPALPTSTVPATAELSVDVPVQLSVDGPWRRVSGAPGVDRPGLFYELMPGVYVYLPTEEDIGQGITWTLGADDVPIIEGYLQARLVFFRAVAVDPIELDDPGWSYWYLDGGTVHREWLRGKRDRGERGDVADGVVLRPMVLGDERSATTALVADCVLDGGVFLTADGELAEGSSWGVSDYGIGYRMISIDGRWLVRESGSLEQACIGW